MTSETVETSSAVPVLHCWADRWTEEEKTLEPASATWAEAYVQTHESCGGSGATCMLERGHAGAHVWTEDSEVEIRFKP